MLLHGAGAAPSAALLSAPAPVVPLPAAVSGPTARIVGNVSVAEVESAAAD